MSSKMDAPQQFSQPSRKGKKAWRKNVDITEVQEGLRLLKDEEIKGYGNLIRFSFLFVFGVSPVAISAVLVHEQDKIQRPIYYNRVLHDAGTRYTKLEKLIFTLIIAVRRLQPSRCILSWC